MINCLSRMDGYCADLKQHSVTPITVLLNKGRYLMLHCYSIVRIMVRTFAIIFFLILCTGCSNNSSNSVANTVTAIRYPQKSDGSFDIPGLLHIASSIKDPVTCGHIVLATDRLTYDSGELQQMIDYFTHYSPRPPLPSTLTLAQARFMDAASYSDTDCQSILEITNIAQEPIQITQIGVKLTTDSQPNKDYYRLIDSCTFASVIPNIPCGRGGGTEPDDYIYRLGPARKATVFRDVDPEINHTVLLQPGDTSINLLAFIPKDTSGYLRYTLIPELVLSTSTVASQVFDLVQLTTTISFVSPDHFSHYQLQGNTFVPYQLK